jgi:hypothetical protein
LLRASFAREGGGGESGGEGENATARLLDHETTRLLDYETKNYVPPGCAGFR